MTKPILVVFAASLLWASGPPARSIPKADRANARRTEFGRGLEGGVSRDIGPGDMVIVPANSPHGFSEIAETITYIVVRVDPEQLVELK